MKETPKALKVETVEENHHGYEGWTTHTLRDSKTNVCIAVVGEVDAYFQGQYEELAQKIADAYNQRDEHEARILELTNHLRRVTRAIENMQENIESGEFTITTKDGEPANIEHAKHVAQEARKYYMGI